MEILNELALFAGVGGGILGGLLHGWRTVCAVEIEDYPRRVLLQRQVDGILPKFPIWDDVRTFDGYPWRGAIDVITGGFPCQDISAAGKGAGLAGDRSGLWFEMLRVIAEVRPRFVFAENSPNLRTRGLAAILEGLAGLGYDARWCVLGAGDVGAPHIRKRMWVLANARSGRRSRQEKRKVQQSGGAEVICPSYEIADANSERCNAGAERERRAPGADPSGCGQGPVVANAESNRRAPCGLEPDGVDEKETGDRESKSARGYPPDSRWPPEPDVGRVADGVPNRVDRLKALGNGQVPAVAAEAWRLLNEE